MSPLKIGLIVDPGHCSKYVHDLALWGQSQPGLQISHLLVQNLPERAPLVRRALAGLWGGKWRRFIRHAGMACIAQLEMLLLRRLPRQRDHFETHDVSGVVPHSVSITPTLSESGFVYRYSPAEIDKIKSLGLDVLIRCGSGILRGDILTCTPLGILSLHHGDNRVVRGTPPGFWEVHDRHDSTGFIVQQLTDKLDAGHVLYRGNIPTQYYHLLNEAKLFERANHFLKATLTQLAHSRQLRFEAPAQASAAHIHTVPSLGQQALYLAGFAKRLLEKAVSARLQHKHEQWHVGVLQSSWQTLALEQAQPLVAPPGHFLADPFVVSEGQGSLCFVEDYDHDKGKGDIAVYRLEGGRQERLGLALSEPFHLSFPFLFQHEGRTYMCPETSESRSVRVYEASHYPLGWRLKATLMQDIAAADSMLFEWRGKWWMLTNTDSAGSGDFCSELSIFHADSPFSIHWTPHPLNPVVLDSRHARNAGLLRDGDSLYRVCQKHGFDRYGAGFAIHRIVRLDETTYEEACLHSVSPDFMPNIVGCHHLHSNGSHTVFDYLKIEKVASH